ncbi:cyclic nucleotide-binding domain-containing protein [Ensifer soli]|uniref:cyclic nucleotide-binding domain-containing protein n=1 Tax=Ciceribacter sp. sgz301302 TaxID=3342379 RepID=UPI0035B755B7
MSLNDDIALLASLPLFADLGGDKLRLIAFGAERRRVAEGQELFREGAPADCAYAIAAGRFRLTRADRSGREVETGIVSRGTLLSELAMISVVERKATATALEDGEVLRINRPLFHRMLEEFPDVATLVDRRIRDNLAGMIARAGAMAGRFA